MPKKMARKPLSRSKTVREVRIFGTIHLALALYAILDALVELVDIADLPGPATLNLTVGALGVAVLIIVWGPALVSGLGLILLTEWGRWLAIKWGKIIVWVLPIAFGLSCGSLSRLLSLAFLIVVAIGVYAVIVAENLAQPEYDIAFEPAPPERTPDTDKPPDRPRALQPAAHVEEAGPGKISFECTKCRTSYTVNADLAGRKAKCKTCGQKFYIPRITDT